MRIDLHVHSTASDGTDPPADVVARARAAGVHVFALTDHDTTDGWAEAADAVRADGPAVQLVPGVEISCLAGGISLHLLGYLFDPRYPPLAAELHRLRTDRVRRAKEMVRRLGELGAPVSWSMVERIAGGGAVGRPHIARALAEAGVVSDVAAAFSTEWIGNGGRAYVEKYSLDPVRAIQLVHAAGGVVVFAHPAASTRGAVVAESYIAELAAAGLDGLEVDHPDHDAETRHRLRSLAGDLGLLVTGSSDYHGSVKSVAIGANTTAPDVFEELVARASGTAVIHR
jgi:predicted metal-dependent phosphoesterase TrpH